MGGDTELFQEMVGLLRADAPPLLAALHRAIEQSEHSNVQRVAHTLKGLAANFGAERAVAAAAEEATTNVGSVAAATEQLSASFGEVAQQVARAATMTRGASASATKTDAVVGELAAVAQRIGDVVKLIGEIAGQTNLLALNATIEAARGEVARHPDRQATDDISAQIASMQSATAQAVTAVREISRTVQDIDMISNSIAAAVEEQSAATSEITRNVQQASVGTHDVSQNIIGVNQAAGAAGSAASTALKAAGGLRSQSDLLTRAVGDFLSRLRAA